MWLVVAAIILTCFRRWKWALSVGIMALVLNCWSETFALNIFSLFASEEKEKNELRVMTFNIHASGQDYGERYEKIAKLIVDSESDVVLANEANSYIKEYVDSFDSLMLVHYHYSTVGRFRQKDNVFYSKYPIIGIDSIEASKTCNAPVVIIDVKGKQLRLVGCHLSSNNYIDSQTRFDADSLKSEIDAKLYWQTIQKGYAQRKEEVSRLRDEGLGLRDPNLIILGDFNDIGGSYTLRHLESLGLQDAWWKGGFGYGGTRDVGPISFRLDHILYGNGFNLKRAKVIDTNRLSDHRAVVADFEIE